jgi:hypothetical protein
VFLRAHLKLSEELGSDDRFVDGDQSRHVKRSLRIATVDSAVGGKLLQMRSAFRFAAYVMPSNVTGLARDWHCKCASKGATSASVRLYPSPQIALSQE